MGPRHAEEHSTFGVAAASRLGRSPRASRDGSRRAAKIAKISKIAKGEGVGVARGDERVGGLNGARAGRVDILVRALRSRSAGAGWVGKRLRV